MAKRELGTKGTDLIISYEKEILHVYDDGFGYPTLGIGHLLTAAEKRAMPIGTAITRDQSRAYFKADAKKYVDAVNKSLTREPTQNQFDAMTTLAFNIGVGGFAKSSVARLFNAGNTHGAADAFRRWNKAGGKVVKGLVRRREAERALFLTPDSKRSAEAPAIAPTIGSTDTIEQPASDTAIDQPAAAPLIEQPPISGDTIPSSPANKTDVVIEKEPDVTETKPKGFLGSLWQKITGALGGGITADVAVEKAQQAQALGLSERTWTFIFWAVIGGLAIWVIYHFVVLKILPWGKWLLARIRTNQLVASNATADSVQVISADKLAEYEAKGYLVVRRA